MPTRDAAHRRDVCHFADDRLSPAQKLDFVHKLLRRDMAEVRMFLDHLEKYSPALVETTRAEAPASQALDRIASDKPCAGPLPRVHARRRPARRSARG